MKIAHIFISMPVGGAEDLAVGLARHMPPGIELEFVCLRSLGVVGEELRARGVPVHLLPVAPTRRLNLLGVWRLARWLQEVYHCRVHQGTGESPQERFARSLLMPATALALSSANVVAQTRARNT